MGLLPIDFDYLLVLPDLIFHHFSNFHLAKPHHPFDHFIIFRHFVDLKHDFPFQMRESSLPLAH